MKKRPEFPKKNRAPDDTANVQQPSLFDNQDIELPVFPAIWPTEDTRAYECLIALLQGPQNQADYPNDWRLTAHINKLKALNWAICRRYIEHWGCRAPIAEYELNRQDPAVIAGLRVRQGGRHG